MSADECCLGLRGRIRELESRASLLERQNAQLASMFLASCNLHELAEPERLLVLLKDTIVNLLGSERFGIYLGRRDGERLTLVAHEGLEGEGPMPRAGLVAKALDERRAIVATDEELRAGAPVVCVPLVAREIELGAIVIHGLLPHKGAIERHDRELIDLLAALAGPAILAAHMREQDECVRSALERLAEMPEAEV